MKDGETLENLVTTDLIEMPEGKEAEITDVKLICGHGGKYGQGFGKRFRARLMEMGIKEGANIKKLKSMPGGPVIIEVGSADYQLGYCEAKRVMVEYQK